MSSLSPVVGPYLSTVVVLGAAGTIKVASPAATRVALRSAGLPNTTSAARALGAVEVALAALALVVGGPVAAAAVAVAHVGFAWFSSRLMARTRGRADCGCFGHSSAPVTRAHVVVNVAVAALAVAAAATGVAGAPGTISDVADDAGVASAMAFVGLVAVGARLLVALLTELPALEAAMRGRRVRAGGGAAS